MFAIEILEFRICVWLESVAVQVGSCSRALQSALEHLAELCFKCSTQTKQVWGVKDKLDLFLLLALFVMGSSLQEENVNCDSKGGCQSAQGSTGLPAFGVVFCVMNKK